MGLEKHIAYHFSNKFVFLLYKDFFFKIAKDTTSLYILEKALQTQNFQRIKLVY